MRTLRSRHIIFCLVPSVLAVLLAGTYALRLFPTLNLSAVNILCIPLALMELTIGFIDRINTRKACFFASSAAICTIASCINIPADGGEIASILDLPIWMAIWLIALIISIVAFLVILIRLFRWTQEDWERAKAISQELRLKKKEVWAEQWRAKQAHRTNLSEQKFAHQSESASQKYAHKSAVQSAREEHARERQDTNYKESKTVWSQIHDFAKRLPCWGWNVIKIAVFVALIVIFFLIPGWHANLIDLGSWSSNVRSLMDSLVGNNVETDMDAVLYYLILYILMICMIGGVISIICRSFGRNSGRNESLRTALSERYGTPAAILIVAGMMLALILGGTDLFNGISDIWSALFMVIVFILVCLTAVELVRLTLVQCLQPESLLNKLLHLIFVVALESIVSFIMGAITTFRIQSLVTSLFSLVFPEQNEELQRRIDSIINKLIFKELDEIADGSASGRQKSDEGFRKFWRTRTWRRRK